MNSDSSDRTRWFIDRLESIEDLCWQYYLWAVELGFDLEARLLAEKSAELKMEIDEREALERKAELDDARSLADRAKGGYPC